MCARLCAQQCVHASVFLRWVGVCVCVCVAQACLAIQQRETKPYKSEPAAGYIIAAPRISSGQELNRATIHSRLSCGRRMARAKHESFQMKYMHR